MTDKTTEELQAELKTIKADTTKAIDAMTAQNELLTADNDKLKTKITEANKHKTKREADARKAAEEAARASGDVEAITASFKAELAEKDKANQRVINAWGNSEKNSLANKIANKISMDGLGGFMAPLIKDRISYEYDGNELMKLNPLDADGNASLKTFSDLETEFTENKAYEKIIRGSSANGNGLPGNNGSKGAKSMSRSEFNKMSPINQGIYMNEKGSVYD